MGCCPRGIGTVVRALVCVVAFQWLSKISHGAAPIMCAAATAVLVALLFGVPWARRWRVQPAVADAARQRPDW